MNNKSDDCVFDELGYPKTHPTILALLAVGAAAKQVSFADSADSTVTFEEPFNSFESAIKPDAAHHKIWNAILRHNAGQSTEEDRQILKNSDYGLRRKISKDIQAELKPHLVNMIKQG